MSLHGSLDLTGGRRGLADARRLRALLEAVVRVREGEGYRLPENDLGRPDVDQVPNPFG